MKQTIAFLGKGGTGTTTLALASAYQAHLQGKKTLFVTQEAAFSVSEILGHPVGKETSTLSEGFDAIQVSATDLLEKGWNKVRSLEGQYLKTPFFKDIYGQELGVLPGFDEFNILILLKDWHVKYDLIVLDLASPLATLRLLSAADQLGWYVRRFQELFKRSPLGQALGPFLEPLAQTVLAAGLSGDKIRSSGSQLVDLIEEARKASEQEVMLYLVANQDALTLSSARRYWGAGQLFNLRYGGVLFNRVPDVTEAMLKAFPGLEHHVLPEVSEWQGLVKHLPPIKRTKDLPAPIQLDEKALTLSVHLPGYSKKEVELSQYGPELTLRVADQRRNLILPSAFRNTQATGAKFSEDRLVLTFG